MVGNLETIPACARTGLTEAHKPNSFLNWIVGGSCPISIGLFTFAFKTDVLATFFRVSLSAAVSSLGERSSTVSGIKLKSNPKDLKSGYGSQFQKTLKLIQTAYVFSRDCSWVKAIFSVIPALYTVKLRDYFPNSP